MCVPWILLLFGAALVTAASEESSGKAYGQRFAYHYEIPMDGSEKPKVEYAYAELGDPEPEVKTSISTQPSPRRSPPNRFPPPPFPFALPYQYPDSNHTFSDSSDEPESPQEPSPQPKRTHTYRSPKGVSRHLPPSAREREPEHRRDHENFINERFMTSDDAAVRTAKTLEEIQSRIRELMEDIGSNTEPMYDGGYGNYGGFDRGFGGFGGNGFGGGGFGDDFGRGFGGFGHPFFSNRNRNRRRSAPHNRPMADNDGWIWSFRA
ncbi:hypothetical protein QR680_005155 [Steinernema hermaphroditum]|uniref:Uncharacterized protein n=1 Tax=Steinernema hermaphroditum TaxID=289476 RepID=A0AA39HS93_9BILA|nr:hypothetical protein QR680_005155 [Steinernema hermaphroditum]